MGLEFFDLDLLTIITAYLFLSYGQTAAGTFAFGQGFLIDHPSRCLSPPVVYLNGRDAS